MDEDALIHKYIMPDPYRSGVTDGLIAGYGVHVWAIIGHLRWTSFSVARTAKDYDLPEPAVEAALAYYRRHTCEIDERIAANRIPTG